jgi:hypothetical protein
MCLISVAHAWPGGVFTIVTMLGVALTTNPLLIDTFVTISDSDLNNH